MSSNPPPPRDGTLSPPVPASIPADPAAAMAQLRDRLTEAALHRFDVSLAVGMIAETLEAVGLQPGRIGLAVLSLHPSLSGVGFTWRRGAHTIARIERPWTFLDSAEHKASPLQAVMTTRQPLRLRFAAPPPRPAEPFARDGVSPVGPVAADAALADLFPVLREFIAQGATEYVAFPLFSPREDVHVFSVWTDRPGGWSDAEVALIAGVMPTLALLIEVFEAHRLTTRERIDLRLLAHTDRLTRLLNRHGLLLEAQNRFGAGRRCVAIYLDLDGIKSVNDRMGHHFGDTIIQEAAARIRVHLPPDAIGGRMGGDEFLVFADEVHTGLADELQGALSVPYAVDGIRFAVTASVGVAPYAHTTVEELSRRADLAMLASKHAGRNRVTEYTPDTDASHQRRARIAQLLPLALKRDELRIVIQPIVSLATGAVVHGECLARWASPELGEVLPEEFVPVAEQSGDIVLLDRFVLGAALRTLQSLQRTGARVVPLSVNVSAKDSSLANLHADIAAELTRYGLDGSHLLVELTESVFINRFGAALVQLERLRQQGIAISLDDFGTGYSSLSYLQRLHFDYIKLDRSMIVALAQPDGPRERAAAIIGNVIALGRSLEARIVAEGVETAAQHAQLVALGCEYAQGFHYSLPLELSRWEARIGAPVNRPAAGRGRRRGGASPEG